MTDKLIVITHQGDHGSAGRATPETALFAFGAEIAELRGNRGDYQSGVLLGVKGGGLRGMAAVIGNAVTSSPASFCSVCRSACRIGFV